MPELRGGAGDAREIERMLAPSGASASSQFTARTMARVRRARWRSEQFLDAGFNVAIAPIVVGSSSPGARLLLDRSGLVSVGDLTRCSARRGASDRVAPSLPLYAAATSLLAAALGFWWWAERDATSCERPRLAGGRFLCF